MPVKIAVASAEADVASWLQGVLGSAGLSVSLIDPDPSAPELRTCELLIADSESVDAIGDAAPSRRMLLLPRGRVVDLASALGAGFIDLLVVPAPEDEILGRVGRALDRLLRPVRSTARRAQADELHSIVERVVTALTKAGPEVDEDAHRLARGMLSVFLLLGDAHEANERGAGGHSKRVAARARKMAAARGLPQSRQDWLHLAARLQDIGHLCLDLPLGSAAPLSLELRRALVDHPLIAADILEPLARWGLPVQAIRMHHERIDGSGYPKGVSGADLTIEARLLGAADVFEALTSARPWRPGESHDGALDAMRRMDAFDEETLDLLEQTVGMRDTSPPPRGRLVPAR